MREVRRGRTCDPRLSAQARVTRPARSVGHPNISQACSILLAAALALLSVAAQAAVVGVTQIAGKDGDGPVTVFYPSSGEAQPVKRGPFTLNLAVQGAPAR